MLCNVTVAPPIGAAPFKVTVPVEMAPPTTVPGLREIEDNIAALTVRVVVRATPAYIAVIVTDLFALTGVVVIVNVVLVDPAAMVAFEGTRATAELLVCRVMSVPPLGAGPFSVTVPVELAPPTTEVGLLLIEDKLAVLTVTDAVRLTPMLAVMVVEVLLATA